MSVLTFLPFIQMDLGLTPVQVGQLSSVFFFAYAGGQFAAGYFTDKFGPKKVMSFSIIAFTALSWITGTVKSFGYFIALRIGLGFGVSHHFTPAIKTVSKWFPASERGRAIGFFSTSTAIAPAIVPPILTAIAFTFFGGEWRPVFFLLVILGMIGIGLICFFLKDSPKEMLIKGKLSREEYEYIHSNSGDGNENIQQEDNCSPNVFLKDPAFYLFSLSLFCQLAVYWGTTTWLTTFLVQQHGLNIKEMGMIASIPYIVAIFAMLFGGWLMDKVFFRLKPISMIAFLGRVPLLYLLGATEKGNIGMLLFLLLLMGFFVNLNGGCINAFIQKQYPQSVVGRATGIANGIGQLGGFVAPLVSGYLVYVGVDGSQNFSKVFIFFSLLSLLACICTFLIKENKNENEAVMDAPINKKDPSTIS
jgi:sugar phosphate permease